MPPFRYSRRAEQDLSNILAYTKEHWGDAQAQTYFEKLAGTLTLLARYKSLGRAYSKAHPTWQRFEHESHIIVYEPVSQGIRVQRLIHKHQLVQGATN